MNIISDYINNNLNLEDLELLDIYLDFNYHKLDIIRLIKEDTKNNPKVLVKELC